MKRPSVFLFLLAAAILLAAQAKDGSDSLALLENKVWKAQLPESIQTAYETEFRGGQWISALLYQGKRYEMNRSYFLLGDTIVESDSGEKFKVRELTDSTLVFQYLPTQLIIGGGPVVFTTDNSAAGQRANEHRLDSIWRRELIWNLGVLDQSGKPMKDTSAIERPRWVNWGEDLERYCASQMTYPEALLKQNRAGYSVVMFTVDTLGLPRGINCLTSTREEFGREVVRLLKELPHGQPCRDATGRRMECLYAVYVPFLPQHYRDRLKADSIREEEYRQMFITWDAPARFPDKKIRYIWNDVVKLGRNVKKGNQYSSLLAETEREYFNVVKDEISAVNPQVLVFFTGPNPFWESKLQQCLGIDAFCYQPVPDWNGSMHQLALLTLNKETLPPVLYAFRTYHPCARESKIHVKHEDLYKVIATHIQGL